MPRMTKSQFQQAYLDLMKQMDDEIMNQYTTHTAPSHRHYHAYLGMSPTDVDAKGMYPYQEPEQDEQGTFYGYKVLHKHCSSPACYILVSPRFPVEWMNGELTADHVPSGHTMFGIHFTKRPDHPELRQYFGRFHGAAHHNWMEQETSVLVKCALSGEVVIETEQGFRAHHAQIIGVFSYGNWQSYQDYSERAKSYSRPNAQVTWEEEWKGLGDWNLYTGTDSNP